MSCSIICYGISFGFVTSHDFNRTFCIILLDFLGHGNFQVRTSLVGVFYEQISDFHMILTMVTSGCRRLSPQVTRGEVPRDWLDKFVSWMMNGTVRNGWGRGRSKTGRFFLKRNGWVLKSKKVLFRKIWFFVSVDGKNHTSYFSGF